MYQGNHKRAQCSTINCRHTWITGTNKAQQARSQSPSGKSPCLQTWHWIVWTKTSLRQGLCKTGSKAFASKKNIASALWRKLTLLWVPCVQVLLKHVRVQISQHDCEHRRGRVRSEPHWWNTLDHEWSLHLIVYLRTCAKAPRILTSAAVQLPTAL